MGGRIGRIGREGGKGREGDMAFVCVLLCVSTKWVMDLFSYTLALTTAQVHPPFPSAEFGRSPVPLSFPPSSSHFLSCSP